MKGGAGGQEILKLRQQRAEQVIVRDQPPLLIEHAKAVALHVSVAQQGGQPVVQDCLFLARLGSRSVDLGHRGGTLGCSVMFPMEISGGYPDQIMPEDA